MSLIGYERVSLRKGQKLDLQTDALTHAGCSQIFEDRQSGADWNREGLKKCLEALKPGDTLVIWKLDRLGRSIKELIQTVEDLEKRDIQLRSIKDSIDTSTPVGRLVFHIFAAIAEFERATIRERINAGLDAARRRGRKGGRKFKLQISAQTFSMLNTFNDEIQKGKITKAHVCRSLGISKKTLGRYFKLAGIKKEYNSTVP